MRRLKGLDGTLVLMITGISGVVGVVLSGSVRGLDSPHRVTASLATVALAGTVATAAAALLVGGVSLKRFRRIEDTDLLPNPAVQLLTDVNPEDLETMKEALASAAHDVAEQQNLDTTLVRANVFTLRADGRLGIVPGLVHNMDASDELTLTVHLGEGSTGLSFQTNQVNIAVFSDVHLDSTISSTEERSKADPELKWIISTPIRSTSGDVMAILNVDGIKVSRRPSELAESVPTLWYWGLLVGILIKDLLRSREVVREK